MHIIISVTIVSIFLMICVLCILTYLNKSLLVHNCETFHKIFLFYMDLSYDTIWKDQIVGFTSNGVLPPKDHLETSSRNFGKYAIELMGTRIENLLIFYFGSRQALWINIMAYFQSRIDNEELQEHAKKMQSGDLDA